MYPNEQSRNIMIYIPSTHISMSANNTNDRFIDITLLSCVQVKIIIVIVVSYYYFFDVSVQRQWYIW